MTRPSFGMRRQPNDPITPCCRCDAPATMTEWSPLPTGSTAFYSYCSGCWREPGPAAPSPAQRTGVVPLEPAPIAPTDSKGIRFT